MGRENLWDVAPDTLLISKSALALRAMGEGNSCGRRRRVRSRVKKVWGGEFLSWRSGWRIWLGTMSLRVRFLALLGGLRIRHCHELWCRLQTRLGSGIAMALAKAISWSSDWTPRLGTSMCRGCGPKKTKKDQKKKKVNEIDQKTCTTKLSSIT